MEKLVLERLDCLNSGWELKCYLIYYLLNNLFLIFNSLKDSKNRKIK